MLRNGLLVSEYGPRPGDLVRATRPEPRNLPYEERDKVGFIIGIVGPTPPFAVSMCRVMWTGKHYGDMFTDEVDHRLCILQRAEE